MNRLNLTRCSSILKDPYNPNSKNPLKMFINLIKTYTSLKDFENFFLDFHSSYFPSQAKQIFDEVGYGLKKGVPELFAKNLNDNIYHALSDEKSDYHKIDNDYVVNLFHTKTYDWKIVQARVLYLNEFTEDLTNNYAQITMQYSTDKKKNNYIVFERPLVNNYSFYYWKIFVVNYEYYKK